MKDKQIIMSSAIEFDSSRRRFVTGKKKYKKKTLPNKKLQQNPQIKKKT